MEYFSGWNSRWRQDRNSKLYNQPPPADQMVQWGYNMLGLGLNNIDVQISNN